MVKNKNGETFAWTAIKHGGQGKDGKQNTVQLSIQSGRMSIAFRTIPAILVKPVDQQKVSEVFYKNADRFCCQTILNGLLYELVKQ